MPAQISPRRLAWLALVLALLPGHSPAHAVSPPPDMALIPGGSYQPLYAAKAKPRTVPPFFIDIAQVTNAQFLAFVTAHPQWRRSRVGRSQADENYLKSWAGDLDPGPQAGKLGETVVTNVSWHAAKAYCEAQGKRLPTQDEWEFTARADATRADAATDPAFLTQLLEWYSKPASAPLDPLVQGVLNVHGVRAMHGLVWEWVDDFNATLLLSDARGDGSLERRLFCGAGSLLSADVNNYAAYMRYALRSSLKGSYCIGSLGFRAAKSIIKTKPPLAPAVATGTPYDLPGTWQTQDSKPVPLASLRGKVSVITMGFTRCKFACPRTLGDMQRIEKQLGVDASRIAFIFLSIDPENDTAVRMKRTLEERHMNPNRWTFLTAPEDIVRQAAVALDFKYQLIDGFFAHSNLIAVLDEDGRVVHREEALDADITPTVNAVRDLLAKRLSE
jgi:formylglycine-generating enzyme required for sulfatase activity